MRAGGGKQKLIKKGEMPDIRLNFKRCFLAFEDQTTILAAELRAMA